MWYVYDCFSGGEYGPAEPAGFETFEEASAYAEADPTHKSAPVWLD